MEQEISEVLKDEKGDIVKIIYDNKKNELMARILGYEMNRNIEEFQSNETTKMSPNEIIGSDEEDTSTLALVRYCIGGMGITLAIFGIIYIVFNLWK
jgi:hypothetical protein